MKFEILPYLLANWWYIVLGMICALSYLFGFRKAASVWGLILVFVIAFSLLKDLGPMLARMF